ncbi:glycoside hydrolase domain-containing protein [Paenibacillus sp. NPDC056579]|uniref:glycoside hydrolase domain-containing protein n=1 Tax=Paenibacillus sp. NPDC056579 TaxID=3345871 RepID=UPI003693D669
MSLVLKTRTLSSLSKVFADEELLQPSFTSASAFGNETYSFQVAYRSSMLLKSVQVQVRSELKEIISLRTVELVPSEMPWMHDADHHVLRTTPGLYPDPLFPLDGTEGLVLFPGQWRSLWVTVALNEQVAPGAYEIAIDFLNADGGVLSSERLELEVLPALLPDQKLKHTEWFHVDCLAVHYGVEVFSERHWELIDQFVDTAARHGINMILTPVFTPPLDTAIGAERPTVQLVDVEKTGSSYKFGFDKLKRWVDLCTERGIQYFEFSHLFTQWGAKHAPKIVASENGEYRKLFGWETDANSEEYRSFLTQFIQELLVFIKDNDLTERSYFHNSDEPRIQDMEQYRSISEFTKKHLGSFPIIDALSDYAFYEQGLVQLPIPANNHIEPFIENGVKPLWTYYCVSQRNLVSNRFFNMPSARNRIIGMQLYKFDAEGFLHWGYNFWFSQYSKRPINPFQITDADHSFPSGDAFLVYPGEDGPIESIRMEVFYEALQDLRALQLLESFIGRDQVVAMLEEGLDQPITFSEYPRSMEWLLEKREQINRAITQHVAAVQ